LYPSHLGPGTIDRQAKIWLKYIRRKPKPRPLDGQKKRRG
jgi:hypothetical protein